MTIFFRCFFWVCMFPILCSTETYGNAYKYSSTQPIHIQADKMIAQPQKQYVEFQGNVRVQQDNMHLLADHLFVHMASSKKISSMNRDSVQKINATGHVKISWTDYQVEADSAVYIANENKLVISGDNARLYQGKNTISGSTITLHMNTEQIEIESKKGEQVEAVYEFSEDDIKSFNNQRNSNH